MFIDSFPAEVLKHKDTNSFVHLLSELHNYKQECLAEALRYPNAALLMNKVWLSNKFRDFGMEVPIQLPIGILQQAYLNISTLFDLRGSKIGIQFYCSVFSLGEVTIDDSDFYHRTQMVVPNSSTNGFLTADDELPYFYLVSDSDQIKEPELLDITVRSIYFDGNHTAEAEAIQKFLTTTIDSWLAFSDAEVTFTFQSNTEPYYHNLLNPYFV